MRTVSILTAVLLTASMGHGAAVTNYLPTRDTFMRGGPTDLHGSSPNGRASKAFLDFYLTDFDRAAIISFIESELGHPFAPEDMPNVELSLNFFSNDFQGYQPTALSRPAVFQGTENWVEGSNSTFGATKTFAVYDPSNPNNNRTWKNRSGSEVPNFLGLDRIENANYEEWGGEPYTYREWVLDDAVAVAYLFDPLSLGLFLNASDQGPGSDDVKYNNTEIYSRDTTNESLRPFLEVSVVPEPGSLIIVGAGALVLVCRRRNR